MKYSTKIIFSKFLKKWELLDSDGYVIASFNRPSLARKAKLYWWLYLTQETDNMKYLDMMAELEKK